ncbi:uncharacterized protein VTP21DRAFT_10946 [Calcarisporiella thermophila]|uniref:uncharacterized protein n=1 Tax=Calcarisporiella thermophila TaxID=911321 RepID=UPI003743F5DB
MRAALFTLFASVGSALAAPYITQPITGTVWETNGTYDILWLNGTSGPATIKLMYGDPRNLQHLLTLSNTTNGADGTFKWTIPTNLTTSSNYSITIGNPPDVSYSPFFTIVNNSTDDSSESHEHHDEEEESPRTTTVYITTTKIGKREATPAASP